MIDFAGSRVVVTGAGGGVGQALVACLAEYGARVVACDREGVDLSPPEISERHVFDLADGAAVDRAVSAILARGPVAAVISNAGWTRAETLDMVSPEAFDAEITVNLGGAARLSQAFLPAMREARDGAFVFIASVNALAHYGNPAYSAAKAGLVAWMRALATEEGRHGIRANAVAPGSIRTAAWDHRIARDPGILDGIARLYPIGRMVEPLEVARAAAFLASPLASGITGATLAVDGGISAGNLGFIELIPT